MRIAYFTNQYPAVSHSFIRREIVAVEQRGVDLVRYALRLPSTELIDPADLAELEKTKHILKAGIADILLSILAAIVFKPARVFRALAVATKIGYRSDRGLLRHWAYVAEGIVLAKWCARDSIDHLHAHFGTNPAAIAMFANVVGGIPYSFTAHGSEEFEKAIVLSLDEKLRRATFVVCVSAFGCSQLMRWVPPDLWSKIHEVHCGVDEKFLADELQPPVDKPRLVCVGRICEHKAQLLLVSAARRLRDQGVAFELVLAGDGHMRPQVEDAIKRYDLGDVVSITGWITGDQVKQEILSSRALVLPSFSENMPLVIMEAMALGRPVVSTYIAGIPEMVVPGRTGWLVPASDEGALAEALKEALATPPETLATMGAAARKRIQERHDVNIEAGKLIELFNGAAG